MKPIVKRAIAAVVAKKAWDRFQESRRPTPKPSPWARLGIPAAVLAAGGTIAYLGISGRLQPVVDQVRGKRGTAGPGIDAAPATA